MKKLFFFIIVIFIVFNSNIRSQSNVFFKNVNVPDSIYNKLENFYLEKRESVNSHIDVYNLSNRKDFDFKSGIYSFSLTGPHFPRRIFIYYNKNTYIFKSIGAFDFLEILQEFIDCMKFLHVLESDRIKYLKVVSRYLEEELGQTYGAEITIEK